MNHPPPSGNYAPTQLLGTSLLAGDPEPISWLHVFRLYVLFVGFVGTEPKLSNPVFCFLQVSDSLGIAAFLYFLLLFAFFFLYTRAVPRTNRRISHNRCHLGASPDRRTSDRSSQRSRRSTLSASSRSAFEGPSSLPAETEAGE